MRKILLTLLCLINFYGTVLAENILPKRLNILSERAEAGDVLAQHELGIYYDNSSDYITAYRWFAKAADQMHPPSVGMLGVYSLGGKGFVYNSIKAEQLFFSAMMLGDPTGASYISHLYLNRGEKNDRYFDLYTLCSINEKCTKATIQELEDNLFPVEIELSKSKWAKVLKDKFVYTRFSLVAVEKGTPDEIADKGYRLFYNGDYEQAKKYFTEAFTQGHIHAGYVLATLSGDDKDMVLSAEKGSSDSQEYLGWKYHTAGDYDNATKWMKKAALQGNMNAESTLAIILYQKKDPNSWDLLYNSATNLRAIPMLLYGLELREEDNPQWLKLLEYSAYKGNHSALLNMGQYYYSIGDTKKGYEYYEYASRLRNYVACLMLSEKLLNTKPREAYEYYLIAKSINQMEVAKVAPDFEDKLLKKLNKEDLELANKNVKTWLSVNIKGGAI